MRTAILTLIWLCALPAFADDKTPQGGESHGADGIVLEKLLGGTEIGHAVELWDTIEYDHPFKPAAEAEYLTFIAPKLKILKGKLVRTGDYLEQFLLRGVRPRWYFVKYKLKKAEKQDDHTNLIVTFEGVQIALNDGGKVQIQEEFYKGLEPRSRARVLMHEAVRSAIGFEYHQSTDVVKSLASFLLQDGLESITKEELAAELLRELGKCNRGANVSPLYRIVASEISMNPREIKGWEDLTYLEDGITPNTCTYETDQCAFRDSFRGFLWTRVNPGFKVGEIKTVGEAEKACKGLTNWANYSNWKLPTFSELHDASHRLKSLFSEAKAMGSSHGFLWSRTSPFTDPWNHFTQEFPQEGESTWGINLENSQLRMLRKESPLPWLCTMDEIPQWKVFSHREGEMKLGTCNNVDEQCTAVQLRTRMLWTGPGPNYTPPYKGVRRPEDQGETSRAVALTRCSGLEWGGIKEWRLPSVEELSRAVRDNFYSVGLSNEVFGNLRGNFWVDTGGSSNTNALRLDGRSPADAGVSPYGSARYVCIHEPVEVHLWLKAELKEE